MLLLLWVRNPNRCRNSRKPLTPPPMEMRRHPGGARWAGAGWGAFGSAGPAQTAACAASRQVVLGQRGFSPPRSLPAGGRDGLHTPGQARTRAGKGASAHAAAGRRIAPRPSPPAAAGDLRAPREGSARAALEEPLGGGSPRPRSWAALCRCRRSPGERRGGRSLAPAAGFHGGVARCPVGPPRPPPMVGHPAGSSP